MKRWISLSVVVCCLAGCESTDGLIEARPVANEVHFTGDYLKPEEVDQAPVAIEQVAPEFPSVMVKAKLEGEAIVDLIVDEHGMPQQVQVEQATHPLFAESALVAAKRWRFNPAIKAGHPVASQLSLPLQFRRNLQVDFSPGS